MRLKLRKYTTTIAGALVTVVLSLISEIVLQKPEITWLTFIFGSTVTLATTLLEQNLLSAVSEEINRKLKIYSLLEEIGDEELYLRGQRAIEKCRLELENLSKGVLRLGTGDLYSYLIQITQSARFSVKTTQVILDGGWSIEKLIQSINERPWYQQNVKLANQGVYFERLFIISQANALDSNSGKLLPNLRKLLERQSSDKLNIMLVWQEDLEDTELIQDFAIVDEKIVVVTNPAWVGEYSNVHVHRGKFECDRYVSIFEAIRSKGRTVSELAKLS